LSEEKRREIREKHAAEKAKKEKKQEKKKRKAEEVAAGCKLLCWPALLLESMFDLCVVHWLTAPKISTKEAP
jgi:hypothetical protein